MYKVQSQQLAQTLFVSVLATMAAVAPVQASVQKTETPSPETTTEAAVEKPVDMAPSEAAPEETLDETAADAELVDDTEVEPVEAPAPLMEEPVNADSLEETVPAAVPTTPIPVAPGSVTPIDQAPAAETLEVEAPEVETPEVEAPEVETPEIETPEIETPEVEAPEVEAPEIETPEIEAPEVETPEIETPEVEAPEIETPEIEPPEVETPEVEVEGAIEEEVSAPVEETAPAAEGPIDTSVLTVVEVAGSSTAFETLTAALDAADLTESLSGEGPFTVFAPTDEAFAALPEGTLEALLLPENQATLVQILTYHVVPGAVVSTDLETESDTVTTVEGSDITLSVINNGLYVNEAAVLLADVPASNGVVHVINQVILPPELLVQHAAPDAVETPEVSEVPDPSMDAEL